MVIFGQIEEGHLHYHQESGILRSVCILMPVFLTGLEELAAGYNSSSLILMCIMVMSSRYKVIMMTKSIGDDQNVKYQGQTMKITKTEWYGKVFIQIKANYTPTRHIIVPCVSSNKL
ncbi:hypothetical protein DERF_004241 [Dermatophagoides farinae]|uniref:Uncharacterized protein n=1 Tax=Dermatophagoides farinae TaxID=6954 RepID=A0A922I120_DERFA|nr:hypothetical protein DERF_004241 [Dermatophagoides farinae]